MLCIVNIDCIDKSKTPLFTVSRAELELTDYTLMDQCEYNLISQNFIKIFSMNLMIFFR